MVATRYRPRIARRARPSVSLVSEVGSIADWAQRSGVPYQRPGPGLAESLAAEPFDYLVSAANLAVLSAEVLALARCGAPGGIAALIVRDSGTLLGEPPAGLAAHRPIVAVW